MLKRFFFSLVFWKNITFRSITAFGRYLFAVVIILYASVVFIVNEGMEKKSAIVAAILSFKFQYNAMVSRRQSKPLQ